MPELPEIVWTGLAAEYGALVADCTEAPRAFHLASLFAAAGCLLGRNVWMETPHRIFANSYSLLIGETGFARKTTAARFATKLAHEAALVLGLKMKCIYGLASVEGLAAAMSEPGSTEPSRVLVIEDEFRSLLAKGQQKAVSNLIPRLTELYSHLDSFEVNTRTNRIEVKQFFLSMLAASTGSWFTEYMRGSDVSGGFLNRWMVFAGRAGSPVGGHSGAGGPAGVGPPGRRPGRAGG